MVSDYNVYAGSYNQDSLHLHFCALLENGTFDKIQAIDNSVLHFGIYYPQCKIQYPHRKQSQPKFGFH
jgi:hypothetical protein